METNALPLAIKVWEDGTSEEGPYLASSADFKLVAAGKTAEEAKGKLIQIIADVLAEEIEEGTLEEFLVEMGFKRETDSAWLVPEVSLVQIPIKKFRA